MKRSNQLLIISAIMILSIASSVYSDDYWKKVDSFFSDKDIGDYPAVAVVDIDNDKNKDVFIGTWDGYLAFYRNISDDNDLEFVLEKSGVTIKSSFENVSTGNAAVPFWVDIDGDMDQDLFLGNLDGTITYYKNVGSSTKPKLKLINKGETKQNSFFQIDVGYNSVPFFIDIDNDGDYDMFIGERDGYINYYNNEGDSKIPIFKEVNSAEDIRRSYLEIDVGECSYPVFYDIDKDGDFDLFIGNWEGLLFFYRNDGTRFSPFFNEINYAISKDFSFNQYQSDADSRLIITDFNTKDNQLEFIFSKINGKIDFYQTEDDFIKLVKKKESININIRMANYYYEISKEKYLNSMLIESKLNLNKAKKYSELPKIVKLENLLDTELKRYIGKNSKKFYKKFAGDLYAEAMDNLLKENYKKAVLLLNQLTDIYNSNKEMISQYIKIAETYENKRKTLLKVEDLDEKAFSYYEKGRYNDALKIWKQALAIMPENYGIVENIILCENKVDEIENGKIINGLITRARRYITKDQKRKALELYARIIELGGPNLSKKIKREINGLKNDIMKFKEEENLKKLDKLYSEGISYLDQKKYEKAIDIFRRIIFYNACYKDVCDKLEIAKKKYFKEEKAR